MTPDQISYVWFFVLTTFSCIGMCFILYLILNSISEHIFRKRWANRFKAQIKEQFDPEICQWVKDLTDEELNSYLSSDYDGLIISTLRNQMCKEYNKISI